MAGFEVITYGRFWVIAKVYAVRHVERTLCGYLEADATHFILVPHPLAATVARIAFRRTQTQILGRVVGVVSPV